MVQNTDGIRPSPYVIRLAGPWNIEPLARTVLLPDGATGPEPGPLPPATRCEVPADWGAALGNDFRGRVRYTRRFGRPSPLPAGDKVCLVIEQVDWIGQATFNGEQLAELRLGDSPASFDVTSRLEFRNELVVEVEKPRCPAKVPRQISQASRSGLPGGIIGGVRLEIFAGVAD